MITLLEWVGSLSGLLGSFLLATNTSVSPYGWLAFAVANMGMTFFSLKIRRYGLLVQSIGYSGTTLLGLYRSNLAATMTSSPALAVAAIVASLILLAIVSFAAWPRPQARPTCGASLPMRLRTAK